jgi:hypothetical protein
MSLSFAQLDAKLGVPLDYPPVELEHTYLEHLLVTQNHLDAAKLWTAKIYEGVNPADLERLSEQDIHLVLANGRTAYFTDAKTVQLLSQQVYRHPSDAIAYGSLPVSSAKASTVISREQDGRKARVLVLNDEPDLSHSTLLKQGDSG